jgi:hypothetical protein
MDSETRRFVRERAADRCEYCRLPQRAYDLPFHIEHIVATQHRSDDSPANLALACDRCNLYKGPNLTSFDPSDGTLVPLFNPRTQAWDEHFALVGSEITGQTPSGRTTVHLLQMNSERRLLLRKELIAEGVF